MQYAPTAPNYSHRPAFIMKVMGYVAFAFAMMAVGTLLGPSVFPPDLGRGAFLGLGVFTMALGFFAHKWTNLPKPFNFLVYALFAFLTGLMVYPILFYAVAIGGSELVFTALAVTVLLSLAAGVYALTTKRDLSGIGGFLMMALIGLILVGFLQFFFFNELVELISAAVGVVLFSAFIAYDIQMIQRFPEDRAMEAGISLYMSLFNLFISVLRLIMALNRR
ncbi:MAG TPA: Bax inhibitor-1 family protein [Candidatus Gracilibacteria bacterium]